MQSLHCAFVILIHGHLPHGSFCLAPIRLYQLQTTTGHGHWPLPKRYRQQQVQEAKCKKSPCNDRGLLVASSLIDGSFTKSVRASTKSPLTRRSSSRGAAVICSRSRGFAATLAGCAWTFSPVRAAIESALNTLFENFPHAESPFALAKPSPELSSEMAPN
jgi:hypothetical protein